MIINGNISFRFNLKSLPRSLIIIPNTGIANKYLKKRTESGFIPASYRGRANKGFIP